jgi:hypothetical protein
MLERGVDGFTLERRCGTNKTPSVEISQRFGALRNSSTRRAVRSLERQVPCSTTSLHAAAMSRGDASALRKPTAPPRTAAMKRSSGWSAALTTTGVVGARSDSSWQCGTALPCASSTRTTTSGRRSMTASMKSLQGQRAVTENPSAWNASRVSAHSPGDPSTRTSQLVESSGARTEEQCCTVPTAGRSQIVEKSQRSSAGIEPSGTSSETSESSSLREWTRSL